MEQGPFYSTPIHPGDVGPAAASSLSTRGRSALGGFPIEGLYAAGDSAAPVFGAIYLGTGASLGHAMAFGLRVARHLAGQSRD
ncbi:hypothetical protein [Geodermatophilus sp. CPCC 205506]|uniref:hypothetical protein n=1 Tax=Geodermatophilus sp. CPCC 205506 TaxID=2936596 RepID=UPI003F534006